MGLGSYPDHHPPSLHISSDAQSSRFEKIFSDAVPSKAASVGSLICRMSALLPNSRRWEFLILTMKTVIKVEVGVLRCL